MDVRQQVLTTIQKHHLLSPGETVVVGVSGGPDSLCLLHVLRELQGELGLTLHVAHLNHQLRGPESDADAAFVAHLAEQWGLPCTVEACDVPAYARQHKLAIEEAARQCRYAFLAQVADRVAARRVAVAHHADDQVETVIMHWLRGAGLAGLRGMLPRSQIPTPKSKVQNRRSAARHPQSEILLLRPLLEVGRSDIEAYCAEHGLQPRFDRSNLDTTYYRNRLRHELIPYLETFNPGLRLVIRRAASVIRDDYAYLRAELRRVWPEVVTAESGQAITFDLARWRALPTSLQRATLRQAIHRLRRSLRNINWVHVEDALLALQSKPTGTRVTLPRSLMVFLSYDHFTVADEDYPAPEADVPLLTVERLSLLIPGITRLPDLAWQLEASLVSPLAPPLSPSMGGARWEALLDYDACGRELALRWRRPGDRFCPQGMGGHRKKLNEFMIDRKIPFAWRDRLPLLVSTDDRILWVCGWRVDEGAIVTPETRTVLRLRFKREGETDGNDQ